jgi:hypothetical protein
VSDVVEREAAVEVKAASIAACSRCGATPTAVQTLLDSRKGRTVKFMRCQCGRETWREDA